MTTARGCGILLPPGCSMLAKAGVTDGLHALFVVSSESSINALARRARRAPVPLAGIEGGSAIPAEAGVLIPGERTTVRWRLTDALIDEFPEVVWTGNVWEINGRATRTSCGGRTASVDLMLA